MANDKDELNLAKNIEQADKGKGGMKKIILIVVALLVVGGGGGAAYFLLGGDGAAQQTAEGAAGEPEPAVEPEADPIYLALSPAFVVNFQDNGSTRYLQIEMQAMAREQDIVDKVENNMPAVRNALILLFSDQDYALLNTVQGKEDLRKQVHDKINEVIRAKEGKGVEDVFFTGFVMQ